MTHVKLRPGGTNDRGFSYLMFKVLQVNPRLNILSPKKEAAYEAFIAKRDATKPNK